MTSGRKTNAKDAKVIQEETKIKEILEECLPSLVEVDDENNVVSETGQTVGGWHHDNEANTSSMNVLNACIFAIKHNFSYKQCLQSNERR